MKATTGYTSGLSAATNAKAEQIARMIRTFQTGRDKATGTTFHIVPSSDDPARTGHRVTPDWCSCKSFEARGVCSHQAGILRAYRNQQAHDAYKRVHAICMQRGCFEDQLIDHNYCATHQLIDAF